MNAITTILEQDLQRQAQLFAARADTSESSRPRTFIVADWEYRYDRSRHHGYTVSEGEGAESKIRWPFHRLAAASWIVIRFTGGEPLPTIEAPVILSSATHTEPAMAEALFAALDAMPDATLVTWGGECKDFAVLRRVASEAGLVLPRQLRDPSPHAPCRIDLCNAVAGRADPVHLPEYAAACAIPAKPSPSKDIGPLVESGQWDKVEEQALADVLTTAVITMRHLASFGLVICDLPAAAVTLADVASAARPASAFVRGTFKPWARDGLRRAGLRGLVFRAEGTSP